MCRWFAARQLCTGVLLNRVSLGRVFQMLTAKAYQLYNNGVCEVHLHKHYPIVHCFIPVRHSRNHERKTSHAYANNRAIT